MKILLKLFSHQFETNESIKKNKKEKLEHFFKVVFERDIRVWHSGKKVELTQDDFDFNINFERMSIDWGGFGSRIPLKNLFGYFSFMHPGDEEVGGYFKSKGEIRKKPFSRSTAYFDEGVEMNIAHSFSELGGTIHDRPTLLTQMVVISDKQRLESLRSKFNEVPLEHFLIVEATELLNFFPKEQEKATTEKKKTLKPKEGPYSEEQRGHSLINDRKIVARLRELLHSDQLDVIQSGISLLESLNDPILVDHFIEGIQYENHQIIPNATFKGTQKTQPLYLFAITALLNLADERSIRGFQFKNSIHSLDIDLPNLCFLSGLPHLEKLYLTDSLGGVTHLNELAQCPKLKVLHLVNCPEISNIEGIKDLPIEDFEFGKSINIESLMPLEGKTDSTLKKHLKIVQFQNLKNLKGISFYRHINSLHINKCPQLEDVSDLQEIPNLEFVNSFDIENSKIELRNLKSIQGLIGRSQVDMPTIYLENWGPTDKKTFPHIKSLFIDCVRMENLDWLAFFPNIQSLELSCQEIEDLSSIKYGSNLINLVLKTPRVIDFSSIAHCKQLISLNINECTSCESIEFLSSLSQLKSFGSVPSNRYRNDYESFNAQELLELKKADEKITLSKLPKLKTFDPLFQLPSFQSSVKELILKDVDPIHLNEINLFSNLTVISFSGQHTTKFDGRLISFLLSHPTLDSIHFWGYDEVLLKNLDTKQLKFKFEFVQKLVIDHSQINFILSNIRDYIEINQGFISELRIEHDFYNYSPTQVLLKGENQIHHLQYHYIKPICDLSNLKEMKGLKSISLIGLEKIKGLESIVYCEELNSIYTENCNSMEVIPSPKGLMNQIDVLQYQKKIGNHYQININKDFDALIEGLKEAKKTKVSKKELSNIKKLLLSRDVEQIQMGLQLVESLNDEALINLLLEGIVFKDKTLHPNNLFDGPVIAKRFSNTAILGLLNIAIQYHFWKKFVESIGEIDIEVILLESLSVLKSAKKITTRGILHSFQPLNLPQLTHLKWENYIENYRNAPCVILTNQVFDVCQQLENLTIDAHVSLNHNFTNKVSFPNLKELLIHSISQGEIRDLQFLGESSLLETLIISFYNPGNLEKLSGLENCISLKHLKVKSDNLFDTNALMSLKTLQSIEMISSKLTHFTPPEDAHQLQELILTNFSFESSTLSSIGPSNYPEKMKTIDLSSGHLHQFPLFPNLKEVENLILKHNPLTHFDSLGQIEKIGTLDVCRCKNLKNFTGFENVKKIEKINLFGCQNMDNFSGLENTSIGIKKLDLGECPLIKSFEHLPNELWEEIICGSEQLPTVGLEFKCKKIHLLAVNNIEGIEKYSSLESLTIGNRSVYSEKDLNHPLEDFSPLPGLKSLKELRIQTNKSFSLKFAAQFDQLQILYLVSSTQIKEPEYLKDSKIGTIYIAECNLKKSDFPISVQKQINWQTKHH